MTFLLFDDHLPNIILSILIPKYIQPNRNNKYNEYNNSIFLCEIFSWHISIAFKSRIEKILHLGHCELLTLQIWINFSFPDLNANFLKSSLSLLSSVRISWQDSSNKKHLEASSKRSLASSSRSPKDFIWIFKFLEDSFRLCPFTSFMLLDSSIKSLDLSICLWKKNWL